MAGRYLRARSAESPQTIAVQRCQSAMKLRESCARHSRLDGLRERVQHVLNFARLLSELVQWTGIVPCVIIAPRVAEGALVAQVVSCCASYLRHGGYGRKGKEVSLASSAPRGKGRYTGFWCFVAARPGVVRAQLVFLIWLAQPRSDFTPSSIAALLP